MIDLEETLCYCNHLSAREIMACIKENDFTTLEELIENDTCPMGDKCEACREDGFHNDGFSLAMLLALIREKKL